MRTYHNLEHWCTDDAGHWLCAGSCGLGAALRGLQSEVDCALRHSLRLCVGFVCPAAHLMCGGGNRCTSAGSPVGSRCGQGDLLWGEIGERDI